MKQLHRIIAFAIVIGHSFFVNGQSISPRVFPSQGGFATGGGTSLSWTMGETFNTTLTAGGNILTQGEQQPELDLSAGIASATFLCTGNSFSVPFSATGYYAAGNIFTVQLSNTAGSFSSPVAIGSLSSTFSGIITCTIPLATPAGSNYHVRVISSHPGFIGKISSSVLVISNAPPTSTIHFTSSPSAGCVGGTDVVTLNTVAGATFYNFSCSQSGILFNGNSGPYQSATPTVTISYTAMPQAGASGWSICTFAGNSCGNSNSVCTWIRSTLSKPAAINGSATGCPGTTANIYSIPSISGAATYVWSGTAGITVNGSGLSVTVDFSTAFVSGTLCVHAQTSCGYNSPDQCLSISKTTATPGTMNGASYVCPNGTAGYNIAPVANAATYNWTCSVPGSTVTAAGSSCSVLFPATIPAGSSVCVNTVSACGSPGTSRCKGIASGIPNTPGSISGPSAGQCGGSGISYSITPVSLATGYLWTASGGAIVSGPNNLSSASVNFPASFNTCTLSVVANGTCGAGTARSLIVTGKPIQPPVISGNVAVCNGSAETYSTIGSPGATSYSWTLPTGATILGPNNNSSVLVLWASAGGTVSVVASNACGSSQARTLQVAVTCRTSPASLTEFNNAAEIYPNPVRDKAVLRFTSEKTSTCHLAISDVLGKQAWSSEVPANPGINVVELNFGILAKGIYMLNILHDGQSEQLRVAIE